MLDIGIAWSQINTPHEIKAAYILNFTQFIDRNDIGLCIIGDDDISISLYKIKSAESELFTNVKVYTKEPNDQLGDCHIIYISRLTTSRNTAIYRANGIGAITVSDYDDFIAGGGDIQLFEKQSRIRFAISIRNTRNKKVKLSAKLLEIADKVYP